MTFIATRRGAQSRLWTPLDLGPTCNAWFDGTDRNALTSVSGKISVWRDKSPFKNDVSQSSSGNQPYDSNPPSLTTQNGNLSSANSSPSLPMGMSDRSFILVDMVYSGRSRSEFVFNYGNQTGSSGFGFLHSASGGNESIGDTSNSYNYVISNGGNYYAPSPMDYPAAYNSIQLISASFSNQSASIRGNGVQVFSNSFSYNTTSGTFVLMNDNNTNTNGLQGSLYDLIILSTSDKTSLIKCEGYLAWKRGLQAFLPSSHPYKLQPPRVSS